MAESRSESAGCYAVGQGPAPSGRTLSAAHLAALDAAAKWAAPPRAPPPQRAPTMRLYCGWCHALIEDVGTRNVTQCARCGRSVVVPAYITVVCDRCGHTGRAVPHSLVVERLCAVCGKALTIGDLVLAPHRRHRHAHPHARRPTSRYGDAAWAMLIIGLTLAILVLALTVLA